MSPETDVFGRPIRASSSVEFLPALKRMCHSKTVIRDIVLSTNALLNISNVFVAEIPVFTQKFMQMRCSYFTFILKIAK